LKLRCAKLRPVGDAFDKFMSNKIDITTLLIIANFMFCLSCCKERSQNGAGKIMIKKHNTLDRLIVDTLINGRISGQEKAYYLNGKVRYVHEYKQGIRNGQSIDYDTIGNVFNSYLL
jgi:hypothetical protein